MSKKLRLTMDALQVESFTSMPDGHQQGTVAGYATEYDATCPLTCDTCAGDYTCAETCDTCFNSCVGSCVGCRTNFGPNCPTQKLTGPCSC